MRRISVYLTLVLLSLALLVSGCAQEVEPVQTEAPAESTAMEEEVVTQTEAPAATEPLNIVATIGQVQDVAHNIAGDQANVQLLLGEGVDPHLYVPVESDLEAFQNADIILYSGLNLEAQMIDVMEEIGEDRGIPVVAVTEAIPSDLVVDEVGVAGTPDPHIWGDVGRWIFVAEAIRDVLVDTDPANAAVYEANYETYTAELRALDAYAQAAYSSIPVEQRRLVTAHDAFQYLGLAYNVEVFAPQGISTEAEASVADINVAVDYIVENDVPAIFFESAIPIDTVEAMIEGAAAQGHEVVIGGELFADTMGSLGTPEGTYIGMVRHNVETIVPALGGTLPGEATAELTYSGEPIKIVATIGQVQDVAQNILGEGGEVELLLGEGVDPHLYVPVESDLEAFQTADIILYSGLNLEAQMADIMEQIGEDRGIPVVAVAEAIPVGMIVDEVGAPGTADPHVWGDVGRWSFVAGAIRETLVAYSPQNAAYFNANYEAYASKLERLDAWARTAYATIPAETRKLVTAHDAFQYLSLAYDVEVFAPQGISTEAEASVADIEAAVDYVVENDVPAIFFESAIPIDTVEAIVEGAAAQGHEVAIGGELFADTMGSFGTFEGTYIGMITSNVETIVPALGGEVPPRPFGEE
jgi:manganese/zinc/iron transport system substrate-binding protein